MPEYLAPGVFVEEIDKGPKPIEAVGTSTACFVGFSEKAVSVSKIDGDLVTESLINKPQFVTNWSQYVEKFGGLVQGAYMPYAVYGFFQNGGGRCYVLSLKTIPAAAATLMSSDGTASLMVRARDAGLDGTRLRVSVSGTTAPQLPAGDKKAKKTDAADAGPATTEAAAPASLPGQFTITVEKQKANGGWMNVETVKDASLVESQNEDGVRQVRVAYKENKAPRAVEINVIDATAPLAKISPRDQQQSLAIESRQLAPVGFGEFQGDVTERSGIEGLEQFDDINIICAPDAMTTLPGQKLDLDQVKAIQGMMIAHAERLGDRVVVIDPPPNMNPQQIRKWRMDTAGFDSSYAAMYYPWITIMDPITNRPMAIPPSGHMAGVWARTDNTRGVHKAPANEVVRGAIDLAYNTTKGEQETLNPIGVNCIRAFPGMGIRVWGARTLSSNPSWRYLSIRRFFNMIERSIYNNTQWAVFEPNDNRLWGKIRRDVGAFLSTQWRDGALFGLTEDQAYYVKCDEELNPAASRDLGRCIVEIGMAPVKPAEFVIFRVSQWAGPGSEAG